MDGDAKRSINFTDVDKNMLFEIVMTYKHVIENKKTDGATVKLKNDAWAEIATKYNANSQTGPRTVKQLHALYDNIKKKARKNLHDDKKNLFKTGGGTFTPKSDELDQKVTTVLKPQYEPLPNIFDSSSTYLPDKSTEKENSIIPGEDCTEILQIIVEGDYNSSLSLPAPSTSKLSDSGSSVVVETQQRQVDSSTTVVTEQLTPKTSVPAKKRKIDNVEILSKRIIERKNFKDSLNAQVHVKRDQILEMEKAIKEEQLAAAKVEVLIKNSELALRDRDQEIKNLTVQRLKEELEHTTRMYRMGKEIKKKDLDIKTWEHEMNLYEYQSFINNKNSAE